MNHNPGLIGKKLGTTQVFLEDGTVSRVTAIEAGPCWVVGKRTADKNGYSALQLAFGSKRAKSVRKPEAGFFKKINLDPKQVVLEFRLPPELVAKHQVGQELNVGDVFKEGQHVDVVGTSKGRGFTGVMKRWNFKGSRSLTHGTHE